MIGAVGLLICIASIVTPIGMTDSEIEVFPNGGIWSTDQRWIGIQNGVVYDLSFKEGTKAIPPPEWMTTHPLRKQRVQKFGMVGPLIGTFETLVGFSFGEKPGANEFGGGFQKSLPLWPLFVLCIIPAIKRWYLMVKQWWLERHIRAAALQCLCYSCRYNLTGNTSGVCPECGRSIPLAARQIIALKSATSDLLKI